MADRHRGHSQGGAVALTLRSRITDTRLRFSPKPRPRRRPPSVFRERAVGQTRRPSPADQGVAADMVYEVRERAAAVARGILDLGTNLPKALALPGHCKRCQMPLRISGHAAEIGGLMTAGTAQARDAGPVRPALHRGLVQAGEIALVRAIARRMTVHAARVKQHLAEFGEVRRRTLPRIGDRRKALRCGQGAWRRLRDGCGRMGKNRNAEQHQERHEHRRPQLGVMFDWLSLFRMARQIR